MAWHSLFSLDRKGHFVKIGLLILVISALVLYGEIEMWWNIEDGKILVMFGIGLVVGWVILIKGVKMAIKKRGG